jgi:acyl-CoA thioester hydrolase
VEQVDTVEQDGHARQDHGKHGHRRIEVLVPMRWGDMDAYGHINNVQIVRMLEEARIGAFGPPRGAGLPGLEPEVSLFNAVTDGTMALVVDHKIRYVRTLEYRNIPAVVQVWIGAVKGASFDIHYLVKDPVTREECVKASTHLAFVDEATGRVQRLTAEQKERLAPYRH